ncbi:MAG: methylmalonyl Co-A mutase-associated GTPase MeaB [Bacteroidetes bacterium]|nr:methylmalonyl Co-A mutase-associated GTPase MeaB [Bacteroidota bacterium]
MSKRFSIAEYKKGLLDGNRVSLARCITLVESKLASDQELAGGLLEAIMPHTGHSIRVGISGVPGVGKSTFIESFGTYLTEQGHKVAVLAIDPSSSLSKGSILGDKTRMNKLAVNPKAFIRPSASGGNLGGVASKTRESILLCEAAGYDWILIETVGVGQSETLVREMTDFFLLLMLAGAGDELQGIKRGIMEICDALLINKADGDNAIPAKRAAADYKNALHLFREPESGWLPKVETISSLHDQGIDRVYEMVNAYHNHTLHNGYFEENRHKQDIAWLMELIREELLKSFAQFRQDQSIWEEETCAIKSGKIPVRTAFQHIMKAYRQ